MNNQEQDLNVEFDENPEIELCLDEAQIDDQVICDAKEAVAEDFPVKRSYYLKWLSAVELMFVILYGAYIFITKGLMAWDLGLVSIGVAIGCWITAYRYLVQKDKGNSWMYMVGGGLWMGLAVLYMVTYNG